MGSLTNIRPSLSAHNSAGGEKIASGKVSSLSSRMLSRGLTVHNIGPRRSSKKSNTKITNNIAERKKMEIERNQSSRKMRRNSSTAYMRVLKGSFVRIVGRGPFKGLLGRVANAPRAGLDGKLDRGN